jgi:hypothetical protein
MLDFIKRTFDHYAAHGRNASIVLKKIDGSAGGEQKITTLSFRQGRLDEGEAVQAEIAIETIYPKTTRSQHASVSFDAETWAALVAFVEQSRELDRKGAPV